MPHKGTEDSKVIHIGFDDTDSIAGRCTTNLAFKIVSRFKNETGTTFIDYPLLIRLNPNIPWKTRGNGAVCLRAVVQDPGKAVDYVRQAVEEGSAIGSGANPGVAFLQSENVPEQLKKFSALAMADVSSRQMAEKVAQVSDVQYYT